MAIVLGYLRLSTVKYKISKGRFTLGSPDFMDFWLIYILNVDTRS